MFDYHLHILNCISHYDLHFKIIILEVLTIIGHGCMHYCSSILLASKIIQNKVSYMHKSGHLLTNYFSAET